MDFRENNGSIEIVPCQSDFVVPICDDSLKPYVGKRFHTIEDGIAFYKKYGAESGFDIRLGSKKRSIDKTCITWRYMYCNKEGNKHAASVDKSEGSIDGKRVRRRASKRTGCMARMVLKYEANELGCGYVVKYFIERHNHSLVSEKFKPFMKMNRNIDFAHKKFIMDCAKAAIGPVKSFRLFKEFVGRYEDIGCSRDDFKTISREMKAFVDGVDAQMVLDKLSKKKELSSAYTFDYEVDEDDKLTRLFWCDPISRSNYHMFGDVVSFDAAYSTNRYCMIFAPFTGKDNHGKSVTFGAGLLSKEDGDSYTWILKKFIECMGRCPSMIVTDQDLGMRVVVANILKGTRHRFCMWHIMLKVANKVPYHLKKDEVFKKKLCDVVWSESIEPAEFEKGWEEIMNEFDLNDEENWFSNMYELRHFWIPAYFRDFSFSGLFKTTSMSESENSRFSRFTRARDNLVEFFMHYESAIDAQRHANAELNYLDESCMNQVDSSLLFEQHTAKIYSRSIFDQVKEQIHAACFKCRVLNIKRQVNIEEYEIYDGNDNVYVVYNSVEETIVCSCKMFIRFGISCSHVFFIFKNLNFKCLPEKYIVRRWLKQGLNKDIDVEDCSGGNYISVDENTRKSNKVISEFYNCFGLVEGNPDRMDEFFQDIMYLKEKYKTSENSLDSGMDKQAMLERFYGASLPKEIHVLPPDIVKTKGSGSRLISRQEKAIREKNKPLRKCRICGEMVHHDARNCPMKKK